MDAKKLIKFFLIGCFVFIGVTSGLLHTNEAIPENAAIDVFPSHKLWLPHSEITKNYLKDQTDDPATLRSALELVSEIRPSEYSALKKGGAYEGFTLPKDFEDQYPDTKRGWSGSLLSSWFFKKPRWDEDGSWNY